METTTPVDTLLGGSTSVSQATIPSEALGNVTTGVSQLMGTGNSSNPLFATGQQAATQLQQAQVDMANANKAHDDSANQYLETMIKSSGITSGLIQQQAERNKQLDTVVSAAVSDATKNSAVLNDPNAGFMDRLGALFGSSRANSQLQQLNGVIATQNAQTQNTTNLLASITAAAQLQAAQTSEAQRVATQNQAIANANFTGATNQIKLKSQQIELQSQILGQAMNAAQLQEARTRLSMTSHQFAKQLQDDKDINGAISNFNSTYGTKLTPGVVNKLSDQERAMILQIGSGAQPIDTAPNIKSMLNQLGASDLAIEKANPGMMQNTANYNAAATAVDAANASMGAKPTKEQREAQINQQVQKSYSKTDNTLMTAGTADNKDPNSIWYGVSDDTMNALKPVVLNNAQTLIGTGADNQFQQVAESMFKADTNQTAKQLANKLNDIAGVMQKQATKNLQSQNIPAADYGFNVNTYDTGFFGQATSKNMFVKTPADMLNYAASIVRKNQQRIIEQAQLTTQSKITGASIIGTPQSNEAYNNLINSSRATQTQRPSTDLTK